jgi:hypothetical protein
MLRARCRELETELGNDLEGIFYKNRTKFSLNWKDLERYRENHLDVFHVFQALYHGLPRPIGLCPEQI